MKNMYIPQNSQSGDGFRIRILGAIDITLQLTGVPSKYHRSVIIAFVKGHRLSRRQVQHARFIILSIVPPWRQTDFHRGLVCFKSLSLCTLHD